MKSIEIKCEFCKVSLIKNISEYNRCIKLNLKQFCGLSCSAKFGAILKKQKAEFNKQEYYKNPKKCKACYNPIDYSAKDTNEFCGSSCSAKFNNSNRSVEKLCLCCGASTKNKKFCNIKCFFNNKKKQTAISIEDGKKVTNDTFKSYLINKGGHKCQICSFSEWGGKPILLILDHIDGNSDNCSLENLRLICSNCDTLTPTYKGRNKGNGRFSRRKKYAQGLSY
jgi:hypothetical protein